MGGGPAPRNGRARLAVLGQHLRASGRHRDSLPGPAAAAAGPDLSSRDFYRVLGLDRSASESEVKKAYRKLARKHHPDKGGDAEEFQKLSRAHEVLADEALRSVYDQHGLAGLEATEQHEQAGGGASSGRPAGDVFSIFEELFGRGGGGGGGARGGFGGFGQQRQRQPEAPPELVFELKATLAEAYAGKEWSVQYERDTRCSGGDGCGGRGFA